MVKFLLIVLSVLAVWKLKEVWMFEFIGYCTVFGLALLGVLFILANTCDMD